MGILVLLVSVPSVFAQDSPWTIGDKWTIGSKWNVSEEPEEPPVTTPPICESVTVINAEDGNWVFAEERYYQFRASFSDSDNYTTLDTMIINFTDGVHVMAATFDGANFTFNYNITDYYVPARIKNGSWIAHAPDTLNVTFHIFFTEYVFEAHNVTVNMWANDTAGTPSNWTAKTNVFHIYSAGGLADLTVTGTAGRLAGGEVFDLYAYNNSRAEATMVFRYLQHLKMLPTFQVTTRSPMQFYYFQYEIAYMNASDQWQDIARLRISFISGTNGSEQHFNFTVSFWQYNVSGSGWNQITAETISCYNPATGLGQNASVKMWVDLWINSINGSSVIGARANAYYYPMINSANPWFIWLTGNNWGQDDTKQTASMSFATMLKSDGVTPLYAQEMELIRIKAVVDKGVQTVDDDIFMVHNYNVFDKTFGSKPLRGIDTPHFEETQVPRLSQGGFLGAVVSAINYLGALISDAFGSYQLNFFSVFIDFLDNIAAYFGYPQLFTAISAILGYFFDQMIAAGQYTFGLAVPIFAAFSVGMGGFITIVASVLGTWASMIQSLIALMDGTVEGGMEIWNNFGLSNWVVLGAILYPVYLLWLWDSKGIDAVISQLKFIMDVLAMILHFLIGIIQLVLNLIGRIIESIPIVE